MKYIIDIEPSGDRATYIYIYIYIYIYLILNSVMPITIIGTHIPQARSTQEEKQQIYEKI